MATTETVKKKTVKPVPEGYQALTPNLSVRDAARAVEFYEKAFGAEVRSRLDMPDGKVGHAELKIGDSILMLGEEEPDMGATAPSTLGGTPVALCLYVDDADAIFDRAVAAGAKSVRPPEDKFWGDRAGELTDPFGHRWMILTHQEDVTPDQMKERAAEFFAKAANR